MVYLLFHLSLEDKLLLLSGKNRWQTQDIKGIPSILLADGPHGVRLAKSQDDIFDSYPATAFPVEAAMGATWNEELIQEVGRAIAEECQFYGVGILLGPCINITRSPLGGRNFEQYSEDPFLTGKMGIAFVKGLQELGVGASVKHFVANEQETNRMVVSSEVDQRTLREIYLLPFEMVVKETQPWTIMCAYNRLNGVYMCHNSRYMKDILRKEWGYAGVVISDWGAVVDKSLSIKSGLDLEMPGPSMELDKVRESIELGMLSEKEIDQHVYRIIELAQKVMENKKGNFRCDFEKNHILARKVAEEAIVLLKNQGDILPLKKGSNIVVLGHLGEMLEFHGGGSSFVNPYKIDIPVDEISKFARTIYGRGYDSKSNNKLIDEAKELAIDKDAVVIFIGRSGTIDSEGFDREDMKIHESHIKLVKEVYEVNPNIVLVTCSGSALELRDVEKYAKTILHVWLPGQAGGGAIANVLFGEANPSGKLTETFPIHCEHNPSYLSSQEELFKTYYTEGVFVGYRYYDTKKIDVMYPFGHGLSYTKFQYSNLRTSRTTLTHGEEIRIWVDITNVGQYSGKEVVQLYIRDKKSTIPVPEKELKGFVKVDLALGETKTIEIVLGERDFSHYYTSIDDFAVESGEFDILIGSSSRDIRLSQTVKFKSKVEVRKELTEEDSVYLWLNNKEKTENMQKVIDILEIKEDSMEYSILLGIPVNRIVKVYGLEDNKDEILKILGIDMQCE